MTALRREGREGVKGKGLLRPAGAGLAMTVELRLICPAGAGLAMTVLADSGDRLTVDER